MTTPTPKTTWQNWVIGDTPEACIPLGDQTAAMHDLEESQVIRARTAKEAICRAASRHAKITPTTIRLSPRRKERVLKAAAALEMTMTEIIEMALDEWLERQERAGRIPREAGEQGESAAYRAVFRS